MESAIALDIKGKAFVHMVDFLSAVLKSKTRGYVGLYAKKNQASGGSLIFTNPNYF
jgi:hypothetical protein